MLKATALTKKYGSRTVLSAISVSVNYAEVTALLGPNGAGKTTLFYILTGLIKPDSGNIFLDNYAITHLPMYRRARLGIGYLPQESSIFRDMTVEDNILAVLEFTEENKNKRK